MHPPTPYPASARTKSRMRDTAFREITARANAVSKSEQDFASVWKKAEEEVAGRPSKTPNASRRYSVASKFAGSKADNAKAVSSDIAVDAKSKLNKRTSFASVPQSNGASIQPLLVSGKNTASSKTTMSKSASVQVTNLVPLPKRQPLVPEQTAKPHKHTLDLRKRAVAGYEKAEPTHTTHANNARGMLLKSACYWLEQVKLAEVMEKHGVASGFFRLAVECEAEPVELLREELISYIKRHSLWSNAIQQVLLSYGVTNEIQHTLFSELPANNITKSLSCGTPVKSLEGILSSDKDPADQVLEKDPMCSGASFDSAMPKDTVEATNTKEEVLHLQKMFVSDASGDIESMDADSVTREVVSYIMSSMNHPNISENLKNEFLAEPKDSFMLMSCNQNNQDSSALLEAKSPVSGLQESVLILNSRDAEVAVPAGSPPSLNVWNNLSKEVGVGKLVMREEVSITLDNDITDSVSTEKGSGEEMCVSMELVVDDTASDNFSDLQSKSPTHQTASSEESNCHSAQTANEALDNVSKALVVNISSDEAISVYQNYEGSSNNLINKKSHDKASETVQVSEACECGSHKDQKVQSTYPESETKNCTELRIGRVPESQGNTRSSSSFDGKSQNGKGKSAAATDKKKAEAPAPKKDSAVALVPQNSRHHYISTPKSSTSACMPNIEAGSRTRRKSRISYHTGPGIESNHIHLKSPIATLEETVATPRRERAAEVRDEFKQVSLKIVEGVDGGIVDIMGSTATPGSAGVRRSARLIRPSGGTTMSTPVTTCVQRQLGPPMKDEKEV